MFLLPQVSKEKLNMSNFTVYTDRIEYADGTVVPRNSGSVPNINAFNNRYIGQNVGQMAPPPRSSLSWYAQASTPQWMPSNHPDVQQVQLGSDGSYKLSAPRPTVRNLPTYSAAAARQYAHPIQ